MVNNDLATGEELIRKRRAFQRFILENPNLRIPVQAGDTSGIDAETGWDYSIDDADPYKHIVPDKKEIRRLAIEISEAYDRGGDKAVQAVIEGARVREDYKERREKEYANRGGGGQQPQQPFFNKPAGGVIPSDEEAIPTVTPTQEDFAAEFRSMATPQPMPDNLVHDNFTPLIADAPPQEQGELEEVEVPKDFKGVLFLDNHRGDGDPKMSRWKQIQLQCIMRPDLDSQFPELLEEDVLKECRNVTVIFADEKFLIAVTGGPPDTPERLLYTEMLPANQYTVALRGFIEEVKPEAETTE